MSNNILALSPRNCWRLPPSGKESASSSRSEVGRGVAGVGEVGRPQEAVGPEALGPRRDRALVGLARASAPLPEGVARLVTHRHAGSDAGLAGAPVRRED